MTDDTIDAIADPLRAWRRRRAEGLIAFFALETDPRPRLIDQINGIRFNSRKPPLAWHEAVLVVEGSAISSPATYELPHDGAWRHVLAYDRVGDESMAGRLKHQLTRAVLHLR